ncbi:hypothetical protein DdX_19912 [Ditylenchus destructor]|uniref:Uncharacterized protein n=1 Tax=Ditylenchus destructor TaxID=166010 RepID=A0AAD4MH13_9BILA|nr:hypothetical protein DdX_19912 [Ditylenchus destructor]
MERLLLYCTVITAFIYLISGIDEMNEYSLISYMDKEDKKKSYCTPCKIFMEVVCAPPHDPPYAPKCILFTFIPDNMICFVIGSYNDGLCWALPDKTKQTGINLIWKEEEKGTTAEKLCEAIEMCEPENEKDDN